MQKWKRLKSEKVYDSPYFKLTKDLVELPDGTQKEWTYWDSRDSAMVLGMTEDEKLVMIQQYRYIVGDEIMEFPAGYNEEGESMEESAKREFEEETGYTCDGLIKLGAFYETCGQLNRRNHIFFAKNARKPERETNNSEEEPEDIFDNFIEVLLVDFDKAVRMALDNEIVSMNSALAILLLKEKLNDK